eukprot:711573-Pyramimonas_sp.AAC.1
MGAGSDFGGALPSSVGGEEEEGDNGEAEDEEVDLQALMEGAEDEHTAARAALGDELQVWTLRATVWRRWAIGWMLRAIW